MEKEIGNKNINKDDDESEEDSLNDLNEIE